jgi:hypothetical protein
MSVSFEPIGGLQVMDSEKLSTINSAWREWRITGREFANFLTACGPGYLIPALEDATKGQDWDFVGVLVVAMFDCATREMTPLLCKLLLLEITTTELNKEDVAEVLACLADPASVDALRVAVALDIDGDEYRRHFNRKCVWALARINTPEARHILASVAIDSPFEWTRSDAQECLEDAPEFINGTVE